MAAIGRTSSLFRVVSVVLVFLAFTPLFVMRLDTEVYRYLNRDDLRVLTAVEMGSKNHELVPAALIESIANLKRGGATPIIKELHKYKLLFHESVPYHGYRLTASGYDCLAVCTFMSRGSISSVGRRVGVGKESDVHICFTDKQPAPILEENSECCYGSDDDEDGEFPLILKLHRLGRISFRRVKQTRDYLQKRKSASWQYLSRLAAEKEFAYAKLLHERGFPVPKPIDCNRHCVLMEKLNADTLYQVTYDSMTDEEALELLIELYKIIVKLGALGLIHGDFNEFNIMYDHSTGLLYIIDFPQMVRIDHLNGGFYFERDVKGVTEFFGKKFGVAAPEAVPEYAKVLEMFQENLRNGGRIADKFEFDEPVGEECAEDDLSKDD